MAKNLKFRAERGISISRAVVTVFPESALSASANASRFCRIPSEMRSNISCRFSNVVFDHAGKAAYAAATAGSISLLSESGI